MQNKTLYLRIYKIIENPKFVLFRADYYTAQHTTATLLKNLKVPIRVAQLMLGHANASTTQQIYQHGDESIQRVAATSIADMIAVRPTADVYGCNNSCENCCEKGKISNYFEILPLWLLPDLNWGHKALQVYFAR
jgi:hypothetical protein